MTTCTVTGFVFLVSPHERLPMFHTEVSRHGRIQKYRVAIEDVENGFTNDEETASTTATFNDHVFNKIQVATLYRITVSAKTAASGYGPTAAINVSTCPLNAQYLPSTDNGCIALNGYFMQADGQTRSCNDLSQALLPGALSAASCLGFGGPVNGPLTFVSVQSRLTARHLTLPARIPQVNLLAVNVRSITKAHTAFHARTIMC